MDVTPYILILYMKYGYTGGPAFQQFIGKEACEQAIEQTKKRWTEELWGDQNFFAICVRK